MTAHNKNYIRVSEAAKVLGVSAKTLRRWSESGKLSPKRSSGGQRFYTFSQLREFRNQDSSSNGKSASVEKDSAKIDSNYLRDATGFVFVWSILSSILALPVYQYLPSDELVTKIEKPSAVEIASQAGQPAVLAASDTAYTFNVKLPSIFSDTATFEKPIVAPNLRNLVNTVQGKTGAIEFAAGSGVSISDFTISNSDKGSSVNVFKTFSVSGQTDIEADGNTDTLTFVGSGLTITTDASNDKITFTATEPDYTLSGWTDNGTSIVLTTTTDTVTVDTFTAGAITATSLTTGGLSLSNDLVVASGYSLLPETDLGSDLGASDTRFNNLYVANINSNSGLSTAGQAIFTYEPADTTLTEGSVLINPTSPVANGQLLSLAVGGYQKALIDEDGDIVLGYYNSGTAAPAFSNDYPLAIYNHATTQVAYIDTSGNLALADGAVIKPLTDSTTALSIANSSGTPFVTFNTTNSRVGIGTTSPGSLLDINGNFSMSAGSEFTFGGGAHKLLSEATGAYTTLVSRKNLALILDSQNAYSDSVFQIMNHSGYASSATEIFRIQEDGSVGIGTTAPTSKLHVTGAVTGKALAILDETGDQNILTASASGTTRLNLTHSGALNLTGVVSSIGGFSYTPTGGSGDVTLGEDNYASQHYKGVFSYSGNNLYLAAGNVNASNNSFILLESNGSGGDIQLTTGDYGSNHGQILFNVGSGTDMLLDQYGKLGIGTTTPTSKLHVTDAVAGKALAILDETGDQAILTASASASPVFTLNHNGLVDATVGGLASYVKAGTISDVDFTDTAIDGLFGFDTTNHRLYFREGDAWSYIAKTGGFQIPVEETEGLETGDLLLPYVETKMEDGALHGLYKKFDVADFLTTNQLSILNDQVSFNEDITTQVLGLEDTTSNLQVLIANIQKVISEFADRFKTKELCLEENGSETCITKGQLGELLKNIPSPTPTVTPTPIESPVPDTTIPSPAVSPIPTETLVITPVETLIPTESPVASPSATPTT